MSSLVAVSLNNCIVSNYIIEKGNTIMCDFHICSHKRFYDSDQLPVINMGSPLNNHYLLLKLTSGHIDFEEFIKRTKVSV
jgi:hypothetical protein